MNQLLLTVALLAFVRVNSNTGIVENSQSPNGRYHVEDTFASDDTYFSVVDSEERNVSAPISSDFSVLRSIETQCKATKVFWRPDNSYLVIDSGHDRHHLDFIILKYDNGQFIKVPFDWEATWNAALPAMVGFGYPDFVKWVSNDRIAIRIARWDGRSREQQMAEFVVRLSDTSKVTLVRKLPAAPL